MLKVEGGKVIEIDRETEEVTIPPTATRICEVACFFGSITSLDLENTRITIIEKHAFANCRKLEEVRFPSCLEEICEGAFKRCTNLSHVSFPPDSRLLKIDRNAFEYCKFNEFDFPPLLEFIGDYAFISCNEMEIFDLRKTSVRHIGEYAFRCDRSTVYFPPTAEVSSIINSSYNHVVIESHPVAKKDECGYFNANGIIFGGRCRTGMHVLIRRGVERIAGNCFRKSNLVSVTIPSSVTEISELAFLSCKSLRFVHFLKDSRLEIIQRDAFRMTSIEIIFFPKSLKVIKEGAFYGCKSLGRVAFPQDSQLERIEGAFGETAIKRLSLPPSVREIVEVSNGMYELESMFVNNDYYQSNEEGSAIFSKDWSELVSVIAKLKEFEIPDCVRVIKKRAFYRSSFTGHFIIPPSVEAIEKEAFKFFYYLKIIEFKEGSRLKSLAFDAFDILRDLIINNENFVKMENGVVMSLNPMGIVFVPRELTELEIPPGVEVICSNAFYQSSIKILNLPKSLKKICSNAFYRSSLESMTFEEGTELDFIGNCAFSSMIKSLKLPSINGELESFSLKYLPDVIEFPLKLNLKNKNIRIFATKIVCPRSSLSTLAHFYFFGDQKLFIEHEH